MLACLLAAGDRKLSPEWAARDHGKEREREREKAALGPEVPELKQECLGRRHGLQVDVVWAPPRLHVST